MRRCPKRPAQLLAAPASAALKQVLAARARAEVGRAEAEARAQAPLERAGRTAAPRQAPHAGGGATAGTRRRRRARAQPRATATARACPVGRTTRPAPQRPRW